MWAGIGASDVNRSDLTVSCNDGVPVIHGASVAGAHLAAAKRMLLAARTTPQPPPTQPIDLAREKAICEAESRKTATEQREAESARRARQKAEAEKDEQEGVAEEKARAQRAAAEQAESERQERAEAAAARAHAAEWPVHVIVHFQQRVGLKFSVDGGTLTSTVGEPGERRHLHGRKSVVLEAVTPSALDVVIGNERLGVDRWTKVDTLSFRAELLPR